MSVHQLKDGRWIVQYPNPDPPPRLKREYFGRGPVARQAAIRRDSALGLRETKPRTGQSDDGPLFYEIALEYLRQKLIGRDYARPNLGYQVKTVASHPLLSRVPAISFTHDTIYAFISDRSKTVRTTSISRQIKTIKAIFSWAAKHRPPLIPYNPIKDFPLPSGRSEASQPPTAAEIEAILTHSKPHLQRVIRIAWFTGLRPGCSELFRLDWSDVLFDRCVIRITGARKGGPVLRDVPIHPDFMIWLKKWHSEDGGHGPVIRWAGKRLLRKCQVSWSNAKKKAGITRRLRLYDIRHDFVTTALESGVDVGILAKIVGSSPETLRRHYQHVSQAATAAAVSVIRTGNTGNNLGVSDEKTVDFSTA